MRKSIITKSIKETQNFGKEFAAQIKGGGVVCLYGDLGAGKTTLVQGIARGLGIKKRVNSPTFVLIRQYKNIYHVDLYRLESAKELGLEELWENPSNIILIEWPEIIESILPKNHWKIYLKTLQDGNHEIIY